MEGAGRAVCFLSTNYHADASETIPIIIATPSDMRPKANANTASPLALLKGTSSHPRPGGRRAPMELAVYKVYFLWKCVENIVFFMKEAHCAPFSTAQG